MASVAVARPRVEHQERVPLRVAAQEKHRGAHHGSELVRLCAIGIQNDDGGSREAGVKQLQRAGVV